MDIWLQRGFMVLKWGVIGFRVNLTLLGPQGDLLIDLGGSILTLVNSKELNKVTKFTKNAFFGPFLAEKCIKPHNMMN